MPPIHSVLSRAVSGAYCQVVAVGGVRSVGLGGGYLRDVIVAAGDFNFVVVDAEDQEGDFSLLRMGVGRAVSGLGMVREELRDFPAAHGEDEAFGDGFAMIAQFGGGVAGAHGWFPCAG